MRPTWTGIYPAVTTKFKENGELDIPAFIKNIEFQIESGVSGIIIGGSLGESSTLAASEKIELLKAADGHSSSDIREIVEYINKEGNNTVTQDGIEYQINARGGDGSLGNNYPGESELYLVRVEVKWTDPKPQVLDLQTYIRTKD